MLQYSVNFTCVVYQTQVVWISSLNLVIAVVNSIVPITYVSCTLVLVPNPKLCTSASSTGSAALDFIVLHSVERLGHFFASNPDFVVNMLA